MEYIAHRINTIEELQNLPTNYGVELDVRDFGNNLIINHDPFLPGVDFEEYLKYYNHKTMIINVKSERIEPRIIELLKKYQISDYFFLDSSIPMIYLLSNFGHEKNAVRFSEIEPLESVIAMSGRADWVWIDCFSKLPINYQSFEILKSYGFKLCLVSPELQGQPEKILEYKNFLFENNIILDAICTKYVNIAKWQ